MWRSEWMSYFSCIQIYGCATRGTKRAVGRIVPSHLLTEYNGGLLGDCSQLLRFRNIDVHAPWGLQRDRMAICPLRLRIHDPNWSVDIPGFVKSWDMGKRKTKKQSAKATLAEVIKEMAKPRVASSAKE